MLYRCVLPLLLLFHLDDCQTTDKYTDEDRPYKFGFNIQGYQHRQEQKDEKGLIKGEYGFITADGYYRVTVYATDENGDFKILSMKNYYVGFPPEDPTTTPGTTKKLMTTTTPPTTTQKRTILPPYVRPTGVPGCSDCWIPTPDPNEKGKFQGLLSKQVPSEENNSPGLPINKPLGSPQRVQKPVQPVLGDARNSNFEDLSLPEARNESPRPRIGEVRDGLPPGVSINDIMALLYRFNYTVGFHGHHEQGYRNGDKEGGYFFDGRDGTERQVTYIANEFGYQPNITLIELPQNDVRIPNELTEKQYGLKGYEFKWFYRR